MLRPGLGRGRGRGRVCSRFDGEPVALELLRLAEVVLLERGRRGRYHARFVDRLRGGGTRNGRRKWLSRLLLLLDDGSRRGGRVRVVGGATGLCRLERRLAVVVDERVARFFFFFSSRRSISRSVGRSQVFSVALRLRVRFLLVAVVIVFAVESRWLRALNGLVVLFAGVVLSVRVYDARCSAVGGGSSVGGLMVLLFAVVVVVVVVSREGTGLVR